MTKKFKNLSDKLDKKRVKDAVEKMIVNARVSAARHKAIKDAGDGQIVDVIAPTLKRKKKSDKKIIDLLEDIDLHSHDLWHSVDNLMALTLFTLIIVAIVLMVYTFG